MKTKIPKDYQPSDDVRRYCEEKWPGGWHLPDVYLTDFIECFQQNGRKHENWDTTYKVYLRRSGPSGPFHKPWIWEQRCEQARRYKGAGGAEDLALEAQRHPRNNNDGGDIPNKPSTWIPASPKGLEALKNIRELLPQWREK